MATSSFFAHTDDHETAHAFLLEAHVEVHPVGPEVHVVTIGQVAGHEGAVLVLPGRGEPGDHRSRQSGCRTEEPLEGGDEVTCRESVQVQKRQDLGDLWGPAAPGRDDHRAELGLLTGFLVHALVVHPRCFDLDRAGHGLDLALSCVSIARHETVPFLAPSRQISSRPRRPSAPASSLFTTLNIGVPSSPAR